jgi:4-diphosphocytidyl-2-C-methyl-D-erythritol kinase
MSASPAVATGAARAKVNLALRILAREETGYHQLETIFCALELADTIEIALGGDGIRVDVRGADLGDPRGNLVYRAATAFFAAVDRPAAAAIRLEKRVPHGAGLGGGSSDAATTLRLLDALHGRQLGVTRLLRLATTIGADVAFFTAGAPAALAWGRGERLLPIPAPPRRAVLLVVPDTPMPTAHAYGELARRRGREVASAVGGMLDYASLGDWQTLARLARNDFEPVAFERIARLADARDTLRRHGAAPALLAGSGSALFGVFDDDAALTAAERALRAGFAAWRLLRTHTATAALAIDAR